MQALNETGAIVNTCKDATIGLSKFQKFCASRAHHMHVLAQPLTISLYNTQDN